MYTIRYKDGFLQCYIGSDECMVMIPLKNKGWRIEKCKTHRAAKSLITRTMKRSTPNRR